MVTATHRRRLLLLSRWVLTTDWFLMLAALLLVGGSLMVSAQTGAWHWFQRSGALMVAIGAVLSTRRPLRLMLNHLLGDLDSRTMVQPEPDSPYENPAELRTCLCGFGLVASGTLIWAYGDLTGCLVTWSSQCLPR